MPRIKVKSLNERVATQGLHMGGGPVRRKLQPYEVVDIPEDLQTEDGRNLLDVLWDTGLIDLTMDEVTRPLDYQTAREAKVCSPTFKPRGIQEEEERDAALEAVAVRLANMAPAKEETPEADAPARKAIQPPRKRRSAKRALQQADQKNGAAISA